MSFTLRIAAVSALAFASACATMPAPPDESDAYADFLVGQVANRRADHQAASDRYFGSLGRAAADAALVEGALAAALATGDVDRARTIARRNTSAEDAPPSVHVVRAADALSSARYALASDEIERVDGDAATELSAVMMLAWVRTAQGRLDDILVELAPLTGARPYGGLFAYQQAMALDVAGRRDAALEAYAAADASGVWLPPAVERHADLLARANRREEAATILRATESRVSNPALDAAAQRLAAGRNPAAATLTPAQGAAIGLQGLAAIFLQEHDSTSGLSALTLALMLDPNLDPARLAFADAQSTLGHPEQARRALAAVPASSPYGPNARVMEAWVLLREGRKDEALAMAQANAAANPRGRRALADIHRNLGNWNEAETLYSTLIGETPGVWRLHFARGAARERLDRWSEAEVDLRRAMELSPDQPEVMNYLGYSWIDRGEHLQEGLALVQRALELRPMSGAITDSLGWAYYMLGDYERAIELLERAVELEPADATLNDHLGDAYWRANRRIEARFQWRRAISLDEEGAMLAEIEAKLEAGLPAAPPTRSANR